MTAAPDRSLRIVVVDDDEDVRLALQHLLGASGHDVRLFSSAEELLAQEVAADCYLFDVCLPMLSGIDLALRIRAAGSTVPIVLMTGQDQPRTRRAIAQSRLPLLRKPFDEEEIRQAITSGRAGPA